MKDEKLKEYTNLPRGEIVVHLPPNTLNGTILCTTDELAEIATELLERREEEEAKYQSVRRMLRQRD